MYYIKRLLKAISFVIIVLLIQVLFGFPDTVLDGSIQIGYPKIFLDFGGFYGGGANPNRSTFLDRLDVTNLFIDLIFWCILILFYVFKRARKE